MPLLVLLAQAAPDAKALASWLEVLFYLGGFVATMLGAAVALKSLRQKPDPGLPQPFEVRKHDGGVTGNDLREVHGRISRERIELDREIAEIKQAQQRVGENLSRAMEALRLEFKSDNHGLHERINDVLSAVSELRGRLVQ